MKIHKSGKCQGQEFLNIVPVHSEIQVTPIRVNTRVCPCELNNAKEGDRSLNLIPGRDKCKKCCVQDDYVNFPPVLAVRLSGYISIAFSKFFLSVPAEPLRRRASSRLVIGSRV